MRAAPFFLLAFAVTAALPSALFAKADPNHRVAALLPEVQKHLDQAREGMSSGMPEVAAAHANLILVDDEVKYSIQYVGIPDKLKARCTKALDGALDRWEKALGDTITFREVSDPNDAEVVVRFKPGVMMGKEPVAGYANWKRTLKVDGPRVQVMNFKSDLQIRTINLDGQPMPMECVRHEIAHEVGHILGLEDSDSTGDLMGPLDVDHPVGQPMPHEIEAVKELREEAHRLRTDALAKLER